MKLDPDKASSSPFIRILRWIGLIDAPPEIVRVPHTPEDLARNMLEEIKTFYTTPGQWRAAGPEITRKYDVEFFRQMAADLISLGFRFLGDVEPLHAKQAYPNLRTLQRWMIDKTSAVIVEIDHVRSIVRKKNFRSIAFTTVFSDGYSLHTVAAQALGESPHAPEMVFVRYPFNTPLEELLMSHRRQVAQMLSKNSGRAVRLFQSLEDVLKGADEARAKDNEYLKTIGYIRPEDLARHVGHPLTPREQLMAKELEKLLHRDQGK